MLQRCLGHEINDYPCELLCSVFLEKMAGALDNRVRLVLGARNPIQKDFVTPSGDGVTVAKGREERFFEPVQDIPGLSIGRSRRIVRGNRHQRGKNARPFFKATRRVPRASSGPVLRPWPLHLRNESVNARLHRPEPRCNSVRKGSPAGQQNAHQGCEVPAFKAPLCHLPVCLGGGHPCRSPSQV